MESNATDLINDKAEIEKSFRKFMALSYFDEELMLRCVDLFSSGRFDDTVRNAFIAVEEK